MGTAAVLCAIYLILQPSSTDFSSGDFRVRLFRNDVYLWNNLWFGGHSLPGYGVMSPLLGGIFGVTLVAVGSLLVGTWCVVLIFERCRSDDPLLPNPELAAALFALSYAVNLFGGRLTFSPAVMFGAACVLFLQRDRRTLAIAAAALAGLCSPVGAVSLGVVLGGCFLAGKFSRAVVFAAGAACVVPIGVIIVFFPEGGWYPFDAGRLAFVALSVLVVVWFGRDHGAVRWAGVLYLVAVLGAFVIKSPLGGNIARLAWLLAGPVGALVIRRYRKVVLPAFVAFTIVWSWAYVKMALQAKPASAEAAYYDPLADFVEGLPGVQRMEVVPTPSYRQADELALRVGIARGWETQLDRELSPLFYDGRLTSEAYHRWLLDQSVNLVALPLQGVHEKSVDEEALVRSEPDYLQLVWSNEHWKLYEVVGARPLAGNGATLVDVQPESLTLDAPDTGWTEVKFRFTPLYEVVAGDACIKESPDGWIDVLVRRPGTVQLEVSLTLDGMLGDEPVCTE